MGANLNNNMKLAATLVVVAAAGKNRDPVKRLNKLSGHAATLLDLADNNTTTSDKNVARAQKWVDHVFAQDSFCKLNGQVATALRSFVRRYGCEGSFPKRNFPNTFAKRTIRMRNIFARIADC